MNRKIKLLLAALICFAFFSCSSSGNDDTPASSSNWDEMTWDKDNWGS